MAILSATQQVLNNLRQRIFGTDHRQEALRFNNFVIENIFTTNHFQILERSMDFQTSTPAFTLRDLESGREFYLLTKFITDLHDGKLNWCTFKQWQAYKQLCEEKPLFLLLGTGENPGQPASQHLLPFNRIRSSGLYFFYVKEFGIEGSALPGRELWKEVEVNSKWHL